jgi:hypothetical protein
MGTITTYTGTPANSERLGDTAARTYQAQQFTASANGTLTSLKYYERIFDGAPADGIKFEIWTDNGSDSPNAVIPGASQNVAHASIVNGGNSWDVSEFTTVTFSSPPTVVNGTKYWVVMKRQGAVDGTNFYNPWFRATDTYAGGTNKTGTNVPAWSNVTVGDFAMEITITEAASAATRRLSQLGVGQ